MTSSWLAAAIAHWDQHPQGLTLVLDLDAETGASVSWPANEMEMIQVRLSEVLLFIQLIHIFGAGVV